MNKVEFSALIIFAVLIIFFGLFPSSLFEVINAAFVSLAAQGGLYV